MRRFSAALIAIVSLVSSGTSHAFLDFFKGDLDKVPETEEMRAQEAEARAKVAAALDFEAAGKTDKAFDLYRGVVKKWPLTTSAAMSQYKMGVIQKDRGDYVKAFDSFQQFVEDYKQSSAFDAAIASQYEIAKASQTGEVKSSFVGIPVQVRRSKVLEMYQSVIDNAPYSEYAPQAQFSIGDVLEKDDRPAEAVVAYKKMVAAYPKSDLAADAQFRIGEIGAKEIEGGSRDIANVDRSRRAFEDLLLGYDDDSRREEAKSRVVQFDELEAQRAYEVGRFYEKQKKYRSAALYYRRVSNNAVGTSAAESARERLALVEAKLADRPVSEDEMPSGSGPVGAIGGVADRLKSVIPRPRLGSRLFGRDKREDYESEDPGAGVDALGQPEVAAELDPGLGRDPGVAPAAVSTAGDPSDPQLAAAGVPAATKLKKRKDYNGPPPPNLALGKKENKMRMDGAGLPFDLGKMDKKDLEKGLKRLKEELPEGLPDLVIPPGLDEDGEDALEIPKLTDEDGEETLEVPELAEEEAEKTPAETEKAPENAEKSEEDGESGLKIPPPPEDDGE